ncbi:uncharacterized protein LACBIDRAFT_308986 [Laccaria bicolor S238N-H82]|uniref:Predicted protein n=1 Tax=Laccaria bicolor (strain S238N-H82 / ATCC MYA-4686) TaxID=486041 RepID=B0CV92_LACBS|nr:uncharacterized protein LACBIDRAFT_308986 [Laccaria bicolor S238N-H82]EDR13705.1 predicted protein [Laccaria bicolor S238N-H82]|eukprot:XP_001876203.1 predicted protein [Laccaria bicolor S238N-H82]
MGLIAEMMQWVTKNKLSMAEARGYRVPQLRIESRRTGGQLIRSLKNHHHFVNVSGIPVVLTVVHTTKTKRESQGDDRLTFEIQGEHRFCLLDLTQGFLLLLKVEEETTKFAEVCTPKNKAQCPCWVYHTIPTYACRKELRS